MGRQFMYQLLYSMFGQPLESNFVYSQNHKNRLKKYMISSQVTTIDNLQADLRYEEHEVVNIVFIKA